MERVTKPFFPKNEEGMITSSTALQFLFFNQLKMIMHTKRNDLKITILADSCWFYCLSNDFKSLVKPIMKPKVFFQKTILENKFKLVNTAPLKNAIDWASRPPNVWADKAAAIVSAAGGSGGKRSQYHIRQIGVFVDLHFINKPELFIAAKPPQSFFDNDGNVIDPDIKERLKKILLSLQAFTLRLR